MLIPARLITATYPHLSPTFAEFDGGDTSSVSRSAITVAPLARPATRAPSPLGAAAATPRPRLARAARTLGGDKGGGAAGGGGGGVGRRGRRGDGSQHAVEDTLKVMTPRQLRYGIMNGLFTAEQVSRHIKCTFAHVHTDIYTHTHATKRTSLHAHLRTPI